MTEKAKQKAIKRWLEKAQPKTEAGRAALIEYLETLDVRQVLIPVVGEDLQKQVSPSLLVNRYDLSIDQIWRIGKSVGVYPRYRTGETGDL